jgi:hypothetical protein
MFIWKYASSAGTLTGLLMVLLTLTLYVPQLVLARTAPEQVTGINFIADTLLFAGTMLVIARTNDLPDRGQSSLAVGANVSA